VPAVGLFYGDTTPTEAQVSAWLDQGAAVINRTLAAGGYTVPVLDTATAYPELTALNELYAAAYVLMARGLDTVQGSEENRSALWMQMFHDRLDAIARGSLPDVPTTTTVSGRRWRTTTINRTDGYSAIHDDEGIDA